MSTFRMYLRVVSSEFQPAEITERLGVVPSESSDIGSRRHPEGPARKNGTWIRLASAAGEGSRPEDFEPTVLGWGRDFAAALGALADSGDAVVSLVIVQEIRDIDDPLQKGIFLSPALMEWLGTAKASLDIDQYVYLACDDTSGASGQTIIGSEHAR